MQTEGEKTKKKKTGNHSKEARWSHYRSWGRTKDQCQRLLRKNFSCKVSAETIRTVTEGREKRFFGQWGGGNGREAVFVVGNAGEGGKGGRGRVGERPRKGGWRRNTPGIPLAQQTNKKKA